MQRAYTDNNTKGALLVNNLTGATGGVTVSSSTFYNNTIAPTDHGLIILTNGPVLLNQVRSTQNSGYGASITVNSASATVTINKSIFSDNADDGLWVDSLGNIILNGVTQRATIAPVQTVRGWITPMAQVQCPCWPPWE